VCWTRECRLPSSPRAPGQARRFVREQLAESLRGAPEMTPTIDHSELLVSELVSNAVVAGAGTVTVGVHVHHTWLALTIHDDGPGMPDPQDPGPKDTHGRGLQIVARLAAVWGVHPSPGGKTVWCQLALPAVAAEYVQCERDRAHIT
jgi:anti-sigma regulatory factor (Ser/Thr protein kinase)